MEQEKLTQSVFDHIPVGVGSQVRFSIVSVGYCISGELCQWGIVSVGNCVSGELCQWGLAVIVCGSGDHSHIVKGP